MSANETLGHLQRRIDDLVRENEELRQKTQTVVKKVETNIVQQVPGMDEETARKISDLEARLSQAELLATQKVREVEDLSVRVVKFNDLQSELDVLRNRNQHLEQQLNEKLLEFEAFKKKFGDLNELYLRDKEIIDQKERDLRELYKRLQELETLPNQIAAAKKNSEMLAAEVERLTLLAKERDHELHVLRERIKEIEALKCFAPQDHEELKNKMRYIEALTLEMEDLKQKYGALCTSYEKEISIVRTKDKEIASINKELQANIAESRKVIEKEISNEEKLEREIEKLTAQLKEKHVEIEEWKKRCAVIPDLDKKVKHLENDYIKLDDKYRKLEEADLQLRKKVDGLNAELVSYRDALKQKERAYAELEKEKNLMVAEFEKSQKESSAMLTRVSETKNTEITTLTEKNTVLGRDIAAMQKDLQALKAECDRLNAERNRFAKTIQEHSAEEKELFARIEEMKKQKEYLSKEISDIVAEKDRMKAAAISKEKEAHQLDKNVHDLAKENSRLIELVAGLEKKLANANRLLEERDTEIRSLSDTLKNVQRAHSELLAERDKLVLENASLVSRVTELETSYTHISQKYDKLESIYRQIKGATQHLGEVHDQLVETCEDTREMAHVIK